MAPLPYASMTAGLPPSASTRSAASRRPSDFRSGAARGDRRVLSFARLQGASVGSA
jgi:hypothetical protein